VGGSAGPSPDRPAAAVRGGLGWVSEGRPGLWAARELLSSGVRLAKEHPAVLISNPVRLAWVAAALGALRNQVWK